MKKPGPRAISYPSKVCENSGCGKEFWRKRNSNGILEPGPTYLKRKFCSVECFESTRRVEDHVPTRKQVEMIEDVEWIIGTDTPDNIAVRVGYKNAECLIRTLAKCQRLDLAQRLHSLHSEYLMAAVA